MKWTKKNSIFRTKPDVEVKEFQSPISKCDYYYISEKVRDFIIENKIDKLPIDLEDLIIKNNWILASYEEIKKYGELDENITKNDWGLTIFTNGSYLILFDGTICEGAKRFTIAHEIGHIVLNHFFNDIKKESRETQASMFAARLLMPMCVLYECKINSVEELQNICSVSKTAAKYRFERLQRLKVRNKFYTDRTEIYVYKLFKNFINRYNKKFNGGSIFNKLYRRIINKYRRLE